MIILMMMRKFSEKEYNLHREQLVAYMVLLKHNMKRRRSFIYMLCSAEKLSCLVVSVISHYQERVTHLSNCLLERTASC